MHFQTKMAGSGSLNGYEVGSISNFLSKKSGAKNKKSKKNELSNLFGKCSGTIEAQEKGKQELQSKTAADSFNSQSLGQTNANSEEPNGFQNKGAVIGAKRNQTEGTAVVEPSRKRQRENRKKEKVKPETEDLERLDRTVFVGNVPLSATRKELKSYFATYGKVESVRLRSVPVAGPKHSRKRAVVKGEFHAERNSMNAYVVFGNAIEAEKALKAKGSLFKDMHLRVDMAVKKDVNNRFSVFVGNLPFSIKEEELRQHFTQCGDVDDVRIIRDKQTGIGKGFSYVAFKKKECVGFALKLQNSELNGRKIRVFKSVDKNEAKRPFNKKKDRQYRLMDVTSKSSNPVKGQKKMHSFNKKISAKGTKRTHKMFQKGNGKGSKKFRPSKGKEKARR